MGKVGLFSMQDFQKLQSNSKDKLSSSDSHKKKFGQGGEASIEQMSPIEPLEEGADPRQNFFKEMPEKMLTQQLSQMNESQLAEISKKFLEEDMDQHRETSSQLIERQRKKIQQQRKNREKLYE